MSSSPTTPNLQFSEADDDIKIYGHGKLIVHTEKSDGRAKSHVISVRGGPHEQRTLSDLDFVALRGPCTVVIKDGDRTELKTGDEFSVPAGSVYTLEGERAIVYATPKHGPGLSGPPNDDTTC